jgi:hypothetical protein
MKRIKLFEELNYGIDIERIFNELEDGTLIAEYNNGSIILSETDGTGAYGFSILPYNDRPAEGWYITGGGETQSLSEEELERFISFAQ